MRAKACQGSDSPLPAPHLRVGHACAVDEVHPLLKAWPVVAPVLDALPRQGSSPAGHVGARWGWQRKAHPPPCEAVRHQAITRPPSLMPWSHLQEQQRVDHLVQQRLLEVLDGPELRPHNNGTARRDRHHPPSRCVSQATHAVRRKAWEGVPLRSPA